jgi:hypothetical protein
MKKNFVTFYSPGTFFSESSEKPIEEWDVEKAKDMVSGIMERHGSTPYGFRFSTRERKEDELDSKLTKTSGMYFLGGIVETLEQVKARSKDKESTLISNIECNGWDKVITNTNSWKITLPFEKEDVVLDWKV